MKLIKLYLINRQHTIIIIMNRCIVLKTDRNHHQTDEQSSFLGQYKIIIYF